MRHRLALAPLAGLLALSLIAIPAPAPAVASGPGTGGWYWPTGSEAFGSMSGWWDYRGSNWHLAQDMPASCGKPVYALGAGVVLESKYVARYGPGGSDGGAVVILHKTASGAEFKALYGHLSNLKFHKGDKVAAGAVIGTVNGSSPNHVHFGIHPGRAYPSDNNPFRGHTYTSRNTYGWVSPVKYLREHPRVIPYVAPALPVLASIATTSAPLVAGASAGSVYWVEDSSGGRMAWRYSISAKTLSPVAEDTLPAFDTRRYVVAAASASVLVVRDRLPVVRLATAHATPRRKRPAALVGSVKSAAGGAFQGAPVVLQRLSAASWVTVARSYTDRAGVYRFSYVPSTSSRLRVAFTPPATYVSAASPILTVTPHVSFSRPSLSVATPRTGAKVRLTSYLLPRHAATSKVEFRLQRRVGGEWVEVASKAAALTRAGTRTACAATVKVSGRGSWRVSAHTPSDAKHADTWSGWTAFTVR